MSIPVTVLMSVYNGEAFLQQAIESILAQTFTDFEFVIYDDCSSDSTAEIIRSYNDPRIVYRRNDTNRGLTKNLAEGVTLSQAKYIVRMDADDIAYPDRLEKQVSWMDAHPDISIMGSPVTYFHNNPGDGGDSSEPVDDESIKTKLFINFTLLHPSIIIRRADLERKGLNYDPSYRYSQDHALYFDCIRAGLKFANYDKPLLYMRSHEKSISRHRHSEQLECSHQARYTFLKATDIALDCTESEISAYNDFASGVFPENIEDIDNIISFTDKICNSPSSSRYFNREKLGGAIAGELINGAYFAIERSKSKNAALKAYNSPLRQFTTPWPLKQRLKFRIKQLFIFK